MNTISISDIVTEEEASKLNDFVKTRGKATVHNAVMKWLDLNPSVTSRFPELGLIKPYAAYVLEWGLKLS